jgi:hypothetical protein
VRTARGFRIIVPLGVESQWAQNVLAAGHCRLQLDGVFHELDEPVLVKPSRIEGLPKPATRVMDWLGFRYLVLRPFEPHVALVDRSDTAPELAPPDAVPVL